MVGIPGNDDALGIRATCHCRAPLFVRKPTITPDQPLILTLEGAATLQGRIQWPATPATPVTGPI